MSDYPTGSHEPGKPIPSRRSKSSLIVLLIFSYVIVFLQGMLFGGAFNELRQQTSHQALAFQTPVEKHYPAFIVSTPLTTPPAELPRTAQAVFNAFQTTGIPVSDIMYNYGWDCCVTYQPEGGLISWEESYAVVLEIATFTSSAEAKTDASDLLKNSAGYSVMTKNTCLFFYDSSISQAHRATYTTVLAKMCS